MAKKKQADEETEKKVSKKEQIKKENNILRWFLICIGAFIVVFLIFFLTGDSQETFEYRGVDFSVVEFCDSGPPCLVTYNTQLPVIYNGKLVDYNFYLRNDPRELETKVPFNNDLLLKDDVIVNVTYNRNCGGKEVIAVANIGNLFDIMDVNIKGDEGEGCDLLGNSMYLEIRESDETNIKKFGPSCYVINVNECEILEGTERFMVEAFVKLQDVI